MASWVFLGDGLKEVAAFDRAGHIGYRADIVGCPLSGGVVFFHQGEQVFDHHHPDNVVQIAVVDGDAGKAGADGRLHQVVNGGRPLHRLDLGAVGHDVLGGGVVKLEDIGDHVLLTLFDDPGLAPLVHHHQNFLFGDRLDPFWGPGAKKGGQRSAQTGGQQPQGDGQQ